MIKRIRTRDIIPLLDSGELCKAIAHGNGVVVKMAFPTPAVWDDIGDLKVTGIRRRADCVELVVDMGIRSTARRKKKDE